MDYIGKIGVFNNYDDTAWGERYAGERCRVVEYDDVIQKDGLLVIFDDGQMLTITIEEFTELVN